MTEEGEFDPRLWPKTQRVIKMKLWEKEGICLNKVIEDFTVGNDHIIDMAVLPYDCKASIAHARMLYKMKIITKEELGNIISELKNIIKLTKNGEFEIKREDEDCHTAIENHLTRKLGETGKKIHTFRSRNEQVLAALRLYYKDEISKLEDSINEFINEIKKFKVKFGKIELPGYTHTRKAMPSSIKMWCDWIIESMEDNKKLLKFSKDLVDQLPLGTGAGYGLPVEIDRKLLAELLGFKKIQKSPVYVQNSRGKFESTILHVLTQIMFDLNKMASDLILFSLDNFGYFEISCEICTGSSMMPQKKNPDPLEIIRANYHKVLSYEFMVKSLTGNLISGYHRDFQLIKEPVINGFEIVKSSLKVMRLVISKTKVNKEKCCNDLVSEIYATEKVYELVVKNKVPFRDAYRNFKDRF